jgi:tRNA pseudouridine55 synthase
MNGPALHGWLILDKPEGPTSAQALGRVRRLLDVRKLGHAGTLDPLASGVLPIAINEATKTVGLVQSFRKTYRFRVRWGAERDGDDGEGALKAESAARPSRDAIQAALASFRGSIAQVPPAFSAVRVSGSRAYALARAGRAVALAPRQVQIDALTLLDQPDADHADFLVRCGQGVYVRAIARDLGRKLGCLGHIACLRRLSVGPFAEDRAFPLAKLAQIWQEKRPFDRAGGEWLLPVETVLADIPALVVTGREADRIRHGQTVRKANAADGLACVLLAGKLVALAKVAGGEVRPKRVFNVGP